ncbi:MAG: MASE3 domain-containing protein [Bacillota bacterium]
MSNFYQNNKQYIILLGTTLFMALLLSSAPLFHDILLKVLNVTSYIVWHNIFEFASIIIAICIFCVSYYSFEQNQNFRYLFLGSMLLLMGFVDFFHTLSYKGMPDFLVPYTTSNRATTFWIIARLIGGFGLLAASIIPAKTKIKFQKIYFFVLPIIISMLILNLVTYYPGLIPQMYIEGEGLTDAKVLLEFVVMLLMLSAIFNLLRHYKKSEDKFTITITCALLIGIFSELSFTLYIDVYGIYNYIGHLLKFVMYFMIFRVTFIKNIRLPYVELSAAKDEIKNYADNLDKIVEQRTEQINKIHQKLLVDLEYARDIQLSMLPKKMPDVQSAAFEACYFPAERVGGDFYNVFKLEETKIGMYIGDVSGHGVSAAMLTVFLNQSFKPRKENAQGVKEILPPSQVLANIYSDYNQTEFKNEIYIVMLYGIFDLSTREFTYASAGLNVPPMILNASGEVSELTIKGFPICKVINAGSVSYNDRTVRLSKGDKVLFYTDGLIEAENPERETYSDLRLKEQLHKHKNSNALQLTKSITEQVFKFIENNKLRDDITFFIMEVK